MIGKKIKKLIDDSNLNQSIIAKELGISRPTLQRLFDREHVDTEILQKICIIFDTNMSYFFEGMMSIDTYNHYESVMERSELKNLEVKYNNVVQDNFSLRKELSDLKDKFMAFQNFLMLHAHKFQQDELRELSSSLLGKVEASSIPLNADLPLLLVA